MKMLNTKRILRMTILTFICVMLFSMTAFAKPAKAPANLRQKDAPTYNIMWDEVLGNNIYYQVNISDDKVNWIDPDEGWHTTRNDAQCFAPEGGSRYLRVRAVELNSQKDPILEENAGPWSEVLEIVARPYDYEKRECVKQTGATADGVTFEWPEAKGATQYIVYDEIDGEEIQVATVTDTKVTIKGLKPGEIHNFHVYAERVSSSGFVFRNGDYAYSNVKTLPEKPQVKCKRTGKNKVQFKWKDCSYDNLNSSWGEGVDGYQICFQYHNGKTWKNIGKTKSASYRGFTYKMTKPNNFYRARVRTIKTIAGKKMNSGWIDYYFANQPTVKSAKKSGKYIKVTWKKITGASSYTIYAGTSSSSKKAKKIGTAKSSKTSYTIKKIGKSKLKKGKNYYIWIVADKKVGSKTYQSFKVSSKKCKFK